MRVYIKGDIRAEWFSNLLLQIGNGELKEEDGKVVIPNNLCHLVRDLDSLNDQIYPELKTLKNIDASWLRRRPILTPTNETVASINIILLEKMPTKMERYDSVDSVVEVEDSVHYPVEFLHTLQNCVTAQGCKLSICTDMSLKLSYSQVVVKEKQFLFHLFL